MKLFLSDKHISKPCSSSWHAFSLNRNHYHPALLQERHQASSIPGVNGLKSIDILGRLSWNPVSPWHASIQECCFQMYPSLLVSEGFWDEGWNLPLGFTVGAIVAECITTITRSLPLPWYQHRQISFGICGYYKARSQALTFPKVSRMFIQNQQKAKQMDIPNTVITGERGQIQNHL